MKNLMFEPYLSSYSNIIFPPTRTESKPPSLPSQNCQFLCFFLTVQVRARGHQKPLSCFPLV